MSESQIFGRCRRAIGAPRALMFRDMVEQWVRPLDAAISRHQEGAQDGMPVAHQAAVQQPKGSEAADGETQGKGA